MLFPISLSHKEVLRLWQVIGLGHSCVTFITETFGRIACTIIVMCIFLASAVRPVSAEPNVSFAANDVEFLNLMGGLEGPRGFGSISDFAPILPDDALTSMTLGEVLDYQRQIRSMGTISSAVGRYQFIHLTLLALVEEHGISEAIVFDAEVQTYLARYLMHNCGFYDETTHVLALGNCLASVWAALPLVSGSLRGQSAYAGDGINRAFVSPEVVLEVLEQRFDW